MAKQDMVETSVLATVQERLDRLEAENAALKSAMTAPKGILVGDDKDIPRERVQAWLNADLPTTMFFIGNPLYKMQLFVDEVKYNPITRVTEPGPSAWMHMDNFCEAGIDLRDERGGKLFSRGIGYCDVAKVREIADGVFDTRTDGNFEEGAGLQRAIARIEADRDFKSQDLVNSLWRAQDFQRLLRIRYEAKWRIEDLQTQEREAMRLAAGAEKMGLV